MNVVKSTKGVVTHDFEVQTAGDGHDPHDNEHSYTINETENPKQPNILDS